MRRFLAAVTVCAACLAQGCSDETPTQPAPTPDYELQATAVIGPAGGSVGTPEFILTVPAGAFDTDYSISVLKATEPSVLPAITHRFLVDGIPALYRAPLHVAVLQSDSLQVNKILTVSRYAYVIATADTQLVTDYLSIKDSLWRLVATVPATEADNRSVSATGNQIAGTDRPTGLIFQGRSGYRTFTGVCSEGCTPIGDAEALGDGCIEAALQTFQAMGFDYTADGVTPLIDRIDASAEPMWTADVPSYAYLPRIGNHRELVLRFNPDELEVTGPSAHPVLPRVARAMMDMYAQIYDPGYRINSHLWLHAAAELWAEKYVNGEPNYVPEEFAGNERAVFTGLVHGAGVTRTQVLQHGYGAAPMIDYLFRLNQVQGNYNLTTDIYRRILDNNDPTAALLLEAGAPVNEWWPKFLGEYIQGNVWPLDYDFLSEPDGAGEFFAGGDTALSFTNGMRDLSARIYRVNLNRPDLSSNSQVRFSLNAPNISDGDATVTVFRVKDGHMEFIDRGHSVTVHNINYLNDSGYDLAALVSDSRHVYPYTGESNITLTATLSEPVDLTALSHVSVRVGGMRVYWGYSPDTCGTPPASSIGAWLYNGKSGQFDGNTFTATWADTTSGVIGNIARNGTVTITMSEDQTSVGFVLDATEQDFDTGCRTVVHITGHDIMAREPLSGELEYLVSDTPLATKVSIASRQTCPDGGCALVMKSFTCSVLSGALIEFW